MKIYSRKPYAAPVSDAWEAVSATVICESGDFTIEDWTEDDGTIDF